MYVCVCIYTRKYVDIDLNEKFNTFAKTSPSNVQSDFFFFFHLLCLKKIKIDVIINGKLR